MDFEQLLGLRLDSFARLAIGSFYILGPVLLSSASLCVVVVSSFFIEGITASVTSTVFQAGPP